MSPLYACGLFTSGLASGLVVSFPIVSNRFFLYTKEMPISDRLSIWLSSYKAGASTIPVLAAGSAVAFWFSGKATLLGPIISITSIIPYTLLVMLPTNKKLMELNEKPADEIITAEVEVLFQKWANLHLYRAAAIIIGFTWALSISVADK